MAGRFREQRSAKKNQRAKAGNIRRKAENIARAQRQFAAWRSLSPQQQLATLLKRGGAAKQVEKLTRKLAEVA